MDDPGSVRALLAKLRAQDAAVDTPTAPPARERPWAMAPPRHERASGAHPAAHARKPADSPVRLRPTQRADARTMEFDEALAVVTAKARQPHIRAALLQLRDEQDLMERTLAKERAALIGPDGERLHGPKYVSLLTSGGRVQAQHAQWAWDTLRRWDAVQVQQQHTLEEVRPRLTQLGIPPFYETRDVDALRMQRRMAHVLAGIVD